MTYNGLKTFNLFVDGKLDLLTRTISKHVTKLKVCYDLNYLNSAEHRFLSVCILHGL